MIGRHQMRGWRKLKSGLMRITGSAHIYYPIREIDACRREGPDTRILVEGPDHYLSFVLPVVQWLNALNWDSVGGQGFPSRLFWFWLSSSVSSLKLEVLSKTNDMDLHSPFIHLEFCILDQGLLLDEDADFAGGAKVELLFVVVIFQLET
mgnify:CR=1 FL=1